MYGQADSAKHSNRADCQPVPRSLRDIVDYGLETQLRIHELGHGLEVVQADARV